MLTHIHNSRQQALSRLKNPSYSFPN